MDKKFSCIDCGVAICMLIIMTAVSLMMTSCGSQAPEVNVSNLKFEQSKTNDNLSNLTFDFEATAEDGSEETASCIMSGIKGAGMTDEEQNAIAQNIGGNYSIGKAAHIESTDNYRLIDAEKYGGKDNENKSSGKPYGDANLCWAASVADMLVYTGWTDEDEDGIFSEFTENYFDDGAFQETGIKFWFNGMNKDQTAAEKAGKNGARDVVFVDNESSEGDFFTSTQVRHPGSADGKIVNRGHATQYAAETIYSKTYASNTPAAEMGELIVKAIDDGDAVGIQLLFYNGDSRVGVHAITIVGYVKDQEGKLKSVIVSDSDNDNDWGKAYADSAEDTLAERASRPNTYDMFMTDSFTHNETEYIALRDYKYSNSKLKYTDSVIHGVTILKGKSRYDGQKDAGTCDAVNTEDIAAGSAEYSEQQVDFNVGKGKKVKIPFIVYNSSYKGYSVNGKPVAKCRFIIKKDGKQVGETSFDAALVTDEYATGEANCGFLVTNPYTFNEAGNYEVDVEILGVYAGGSKLDEAYIGNNYAKNIARVKVAG